METKHFIGLCSVFSNFPSQKYKEVNLKQISYIFMYFCFILTAFSHCSCQQIPFKQEWKAADHSIEIGLNLKEPQTIISIKNKKEKQK